MSTKDLQKIETSCILACVSCFIWNKSNTPSSFHTVGKCVVNLKMALTTAELLPFSKLKPVQQVLCFQKEKKWQIGRSRPILYGFIAIVCVCYVCSGRGLCVVQTGTSPFCLAVVLMERLHWVRHRCMQLISTDRRGWYSPPSPLPPKSSLDAQDPLVQRLSGKRRVVVSQHGPQHAEYHSFSKGFQDNSIRTTKYTLISFIPMNLFQQFHRWAENIMSKLFNGVFVFRSFCLLLTHLGSCNRSANLYFLFLVLLNWVPVVEAFQKEITMIPLAVVLTVIAFKDAMEDYRRYRYDKKINNTLTHVYSGSVCVRSCLSGVVSVSGMCFFVCFSWWKKKWQAYLQPDKFSILQVC